MQSITRPICSRRARFGRTKLPSTVVHAAFAGLLAAALLGPAFDKRAVLLVVGLTALADLDVFVGLVLQGTHRAAFHTLLLPLGCAGLLYYDTQIRDRSWLRQHYGAWGVRVGWVSIVVYIAAAIGLDLFTYLGVNIFYPLHDQFYTFTGEVGYAVGDGWVQTFVEIGSEDDGRLAVDAGQRGSTRDVHVASGIDPEPGPDATDTERHFPLVFNGWQLLLVTTSTFILIAKLWLQGPEPSEGLTRD